MNRVLITGAAGNIGSTLRAGLAGRYGELRLTDIAPMPPAGAGEEVVRADLTDMAACERLMQGVECVVHMGGQSVEGAWDDVLARNIVAVYNIYESAHRAGVRRVVFASSHHAVGFTPIEEPLEEDALPRPDTRYGVSKVFGEALGHMYVDKHGMSVSCLRIGSFLPKPLIERHLWTWLSPRDGTELVRCCIDAAYDFVIVYGISANTRTKWGTKSFAAIGYVPRDDAEAYAAEVADKSPPPGDPAGRFHGGPYPAMEYTHS